MFGSKVAVYYTGTLEKDKEKELVEHLERFSSTVIRHEIN